MKVIPKIYYNVVYRNGEYCFKAEYFFVKFEKEGQKTNNHKMSQFVDLHHL